MALSTIPVYPAFEPDEEPSSLPQKWDEWIDGLEIMMAMDVSDHKRKWALLRHYGGAKIRTIET